MAYTGGNSGYVRRLGKIPSSGGGAPTSPVDGYSAWFDAAVDVYEVADTTPATDGSPVRQWKSRGGSFGALALATASALDTRYLVSSVNGLPTVQQTGTGAMSTPNGVLGTLQPTTGHTALVVCFGDSDPVNGGPFYGTSNKYAVFHDGGNHRSYIFTSAGYKIVNKAASYRDWHIFTRLVTSNGIYAGVDDTRTASMAYTDFGGGVPEGYTSDPLQMPPSFYSINQELAEVIFYPSALSETDRKLTEQYLANKYGITLPY